MELPHCPELGFLLRPAQTFSRGKHHFYMLKNQTLIQIKMIKRSKREGQNKDGLDQMF